jgi:hypothetical protein
MALIKVFIVQITPVKGKAENLEKSKHYWEKGTFHGNKSL